MIELLIGIMSFSIGYFYGVVSGYNTHQREKEHDEILNVNVIEEQGTFLFYNLKTGEFILQHSSLEEGAEQIATDRNVIVVISKTEVVDESV